MPHRNSVIFQKLAVLSSFMLFSVFRHCPTLSEHANNVDKILESWREYKMAVPTYGAILMDPGLQYVSGLQRKRHPLKWNIITCIFADIYH